MDEYTSAISRLPPFLKQPLTELKLEKMAEIQEIHLRSDRPVMVTRWDGQWDIARLLQKEPGSIRTSHGQLKECFYALCANSLHSYERQLAQGFFTLPGGHRVGVGGILQCENGALRGFRSVTSLNIRIARSILCSIPLPLKRHLESPEFRGMVLIGPPGSGKTTLLRTLSNLLSDEGKKVAVVDERMEIWPCGPFGFAGNVPLNCDVLSGFPKQEGIEKALRCLGPDVILCDELGSAEDLDAVRRGAAAGVCAVCTLHGNEMEAPCLRFQKSREELGRLFSSLVLLGQEPHPGVIREVCLL